jgi:hypothetical protein
LITSSLDAFVLISSLPWTSDEPPNFGYGLTVHVEQCHRTMVFTLINCGLGHGQIRTRLPKNAYSSEQDRKSWFIGKPELDGTDNEPHMKSGIEKSGVQNESVLSTWDIVQLCMNSIRIFQITPRGPHTLEGRAVPDPVVG